MIRIKGFDVGDELYRGVRSLVFRGARKSDNLPVVIKTHAAEFPTHAEIRRYEHEFEIGRSIRDDHVIRYLDLTPCNNGKAIIEEARGRVNLKQYFQTSGLGLEQFLSIAIQLTRGLDAIHKAHVIHKDIKPSNIIIDSDSSRIKIIDFSISSRARKEIPDAVNPEKVGGTLPYISPEQTGRINRAVDFRSDFYSLGVTLYEMLTGRLPFEFVDPMEQIHAHIARLPEPPLALAPGTPRMLSRIVMKLLSKAAEDRYQGGRGLRADLERCARDLETSGGISPFTPGKEDFSETFQIPRKLYGRCREKKTLLDVFEKVRQGERRMLLAFGPAGMGKSALVKETMRPAVLKHGYFVSGGFEELKRGTPYFGLIRAFQGLIDEILSQSNEKMAAWKTRILSALGPNARIIMDVVPGLEDILGPRPPAPELNPAEAQNRFEQMFRNFIRALCRPGRPLVLFLNDLQYADPASLDLIAHAMTDARVNTFLLIGACREDGASPGRGLSALLERLEKSGESPVRMSLTRLSLAHVTRMVAETLQSDENVAAPLARLVHEKTDGNPYFAELFLKNLHAEGVIRFENPADAAPGWRWDPAEIENRDVTDNVVDLLIRKLEGLPDPTRKALQLAACMGNRFHMEELEKIFGKGETELADDLGPALDEGLVVGARAPGASRGRPRTRAFEFAHGDVRRAAHALMEETEKNRAHLKIGEAMLSNVREDDPGEKIFDIASHLNQGGEYILYDPEIKKLVELNLLAGKRAKASNAHASSLNYLRAGIDWMEGGEGAREGTRGGARGGARGGDRGGALGLKRDALAFALHVEAAEASFLALDHAGMTSHIRAALGFAKTPLEKIRVREIEIDAAVAWNNMQKAIEIGISLLRSMGIRFPKKPNKLHVVAALLKTRIALVGKRVEDLEKLPEMTDPDKILAIRLMWKINHAAFVVNPGLYVMLALKAIRMFVAFGVTGQWLCFSHYGFILCGALGDVEKGYQFGELDQKMLTRFENSVSRADVNNAHNVLIRGWKEHLRDILPDLLENYRIGLENGELQMAGVSLYVYGLFSFLAGKELGGLTREMDEHYQMLAALEHEMSIYIQAMNRRMAANFMEASDDPCALTCEAFDEKEMLAYYQKENDLNALINYYFCKSILGCYFGRRPQALESLAREESHLKDLPSTAAHAIFAFYDSLTRLAIPPGASRSERRAVFRKVKANQKKLNKWAFHAPMNFMHKFYLVEAEWMRARGDGEAPEFYERAMALAHEHEYIHEEALANELYANYWLGRRKEKIARLYLTEAHYLYTRWGAGAKVLDLEKKHPWLGPGCAAETRDDTDQTTNSSTLSLSTFLDMSTVMKALRAISSEIDLESLMTRMMKIILETAGARKGFLLRKSAGRIYVDAVADMDSADVKTFWSVRLDDFRDLCGEIVHYVVRTGENVVLHDASREGRFTRAPYILENRPKSILCTPLLRENKLAGVLYLENNLIPDAFTEDRIETLQILLAQAAISLENAELYKKSRFAEKQARESEAHFRDLFEQSNDAIFIHDFHGKLLDVNGRACEMLGRSRERLVDSPIKKVHAKGTFKKTLDAFEICREEGSVIFEAVFRKADQGKIDVEISARIIDPLKGLVQAVVRDVTERNRTWEMMIQNEKMMTVGGLAAGMAHEVNNPLGGILQNVQVMRKRLSGKMPKNRRTAEECGVGMDAIEAYMEKRGLMTMMDVILDAGARAKKIVDSMLDFSRASETRLTPCDLTEILDNSVHLAATDYDAKKKFDFRQIEIIREYEKTPEVMCERGKIQQVVLNILKNGAQAMAESRERGAPDDPTAPPRFILRARREKETAVIEIEDNGPGMDEAVRKRIFDPFFTTKKAGVGTGLGLSVSYFIITENHGGVMEAASEPGEGATFIIKLPIGGASVPRGGEG